MHPVDSGYQKMASLWHSSISSLLPSPCSLSPLVVSTPVTHADVNHEYIYTVVGSGFPPPTYALDTAPSGMSIHPTSGEISWIPSNLQAGNHAVVVEIYNSEGTVTHEFTIEAGEPPVFTSSPVTQTMVSQPYDYQISANGTNPISFSPLLAPQGMNIVSRTGAVSWTPAMTQTGEHGVEIQAFNADGQAVQTYMLSVLALPEIPSIPSIFASANIPYSYAVTADGYPNPTFALQNQPDGLHIDTNSGLLSWTPTTFDAGPHAITVTAVNDAGSDWQTYTLTVTSAPLITSNPITVTTPSDLYLYELMAVGIQPITYTLIKGAAGMALKGISGQLTWNPTIDDVGTYNIKLQANNAIGTYIQTFALNVTAAPIITSVPVTEADAEAIYNYQVNAAGSPPISYTLPIHPEEMTINASGVISWTPSLNDVGNHTVWARVTNNYGFDTQSFNVVVVGTPEINSTPVMLAVVEEQYAYTLEVIGVKPLNYVLSEALIGLRINRRTGLITWTPTWGQAGFHTVTLEVTNTIGIDIQTYSLKVLRAPAFTSTPITDIPVNQNIITC